MNSVGAQQLFLAAHSGIGVDISVPVAEEPLDDDVELLPVEDELLEDDLEVLSLGEVSGAA